MTDICNKKIPCCRCPDADTCTKEKLKNLFLIMRVIMSCLCRFYNKYSPLIRRAFYYLLPCVYLFSSRTCDHLSRHTCDYVPRLSKTAANYLVMPGQKIIQKSHHKNLPVF